MLLAAMLPATIGCSEDSSYVDDPTDTAAVTPDSGKVTVTVTCQAPTSSVAKTREAGDGTTADYLYYALYSVDEDDNLTLVETNVDGYDDKSTGVTYQFSKNGVSWESDSGTIAIPLHVDAGIHYKMAFYAGPQWSTLWTPHYMFNPQEATIEMQWGDLADLLARRELNYYSDMEYLDVFCASLDFVAIREQEDLSVVLRRAVAYFDVYEAKSLDYVEQIWSAFLWHYSACFSISKLYRTLNILTNKLSDPEEDICWYDDPYPAPHYAYCYLLMGESEDGETEQNVTITLWDRANSKSMNHSTDSQYGGFNPDDLDYAIIINDVPLKQNYKTLIGLSSDVRMDYYEVSGRDIKIDREFMGTYDISVD